MIHIDWEHCRIKQEKPDLAYLRDIAFCTNANCCSLHEAEGINNKYKQLLKEKSLELFDPKRLKIIKTRQRAEEENRKKIAGVLTKIEKRQKKEEQEERRLQLQSRHINIPINKNKVLEDKLDQQTKIIELLAEELTKTKEKNLVENIITREPNVIRPSTFTPPNSQNDASEFMIECVYWYEEVHNQLPIQKELWRLIKAIATDNDVTIRGFLVEMNKNTVEIEEKKLSKEQCRKFFKKYLK